MAAILSNATHTNAGEGTPESLAISNTMIKGYKKVKVIPEEVGQIQLEMPYCRCLLVSGIMERTDTTCRSR